MEMVKYVLEIKCETDENAQPLLDALKDDNRFKEVIKYKYDPVKKRVLLLCKGKKTEHIFK
jgi:hypothetical protein